MKRRKQGRGLRAGLAAAALAVLGLGMVLALRPAPPPVPADRALPPDPPQDRPLRLSFAGTSLTAYYDWPKHLGAALANCTGRPVSVQTLAKGGETSAWGRDQVPALAAQEPDIVVIEFAINDADLRRLTTLSGSLAQHRELIGGLRELSPDTRIVLMTMSPATGLRRALRPGLTQYYANYRALAQELDTGLVDLYPRWLMREDPGAGMGDGVHPDAGVVEAMILPVLVPYLSALAGAPDCAHP